MRILLRHYALRLWRALGVVGLLGGSVAAAIRRVRPQTTLVGMARSGEKREQLTKAGIVDLAVDTVEAAR